MKQQSLQGTENIVSSLELVLIETKEQLEVKNQRVKELQSQLRDKENEISFLKEILSSRSTLISHQVNTITGLQEKLTGLLEKESPVIIMKTYVSEEELAETAI